MKNTKKPIKLYLPPDLSAHVEGIDGRKVPAMIFAALRAQWLKPDAKTVEEVIRGTVPMDDDFVYPVIGSIPAERKNG